MALKETIACLGLESEIYRSFIQKLANENYRLLLVSENEEQLVHYSKNIQTSLPDANVEVISCAKEGCWEADLILLADQATVNSEIINKIREVATQKIMVCLSLYNDDEFLAGERTKNLQRWLPHTKVIQLLLDISDNKASLSGKDAATLAIITGILEKSGFCIKQAGRE